MFKRLSSVILASLLAACGGGDDGSGGSGGAGIAQVVSFGDSLSDVGTYAVRGAPGAIGPALFGGGRYTTNPGTIWTERLASRYGTSLTPAVQGGFGQYPIALGGLGYAQGGAQVSTVVSDDYSGALALPITQQLSLYLSQYRGFSPDQLILLQGGGNDIVNAVLAAYQGDIPLSAVAPLVNQAAFDLADVTGRIAATGGQRIVLVNVANIGVTPLANLYPAAAGQLTAMSQLFNSTLLAALSRQAQPPPGDLVLVDSYGWSTDLAYHYAQNGFAVGAQDVACSTRKIVEEAFFQGLPDPGEFILENGSSLLCSQATLTTPSADQTYLFADLLHPSTRTHALFAAFVEQQIAAQAF